MPANLVMIKITDIDPIAHELYFSRFYQRQKTEGVKLPSFEIDDNLTPVKMQTKQLLH